MTAKQFEERRGSQGGNTLIDLVIVMGLIAVGAFMFLPGLVGATSKHRVNDAARQLENTLQYARMRAISERTDYVVQFSEDGFQAYADKDGNGSMDSGEQSVLRAPVQFPGSIGFAYPEHDSTLNAASSLSASGCKCVVFKSDGAMQNTLSDTTVRSVAIGDGREFRQVSVSEGGAVTIEKWNSTRKEWE